MDPEYFAPDSEHDPEVPLPPLPSLPPPPPPPGQLLAPSLVTAPPPPTAVQEEPQPHDRPPRKRRRTANGVQSSADLKKTLGKMYIHATEFYQVASKYFSIHCPFGSQQYIGRFKNHMISLYGSEAYRANEDHLCNSYKNFASRIRRDRHWTKPNSHRLRSTAVPQFGFSNCFLYHNPGGYNMLNVSIFEEDNRVTLEQLVALPRAEIDRRCTFFLRHVVPLNGRYHSKAAFHEFYRAFRRNNPYASEVGLKDGADEPTPEDQAHLRWLDLESDDDQEEEE